VIKIFKTLTLITLLTMVTGCTFLIKTEDVADYRKYKEISKDSTITQAVKILGTPASTGIHFYNGNKHNIEAYIGMYGKFGMSAATYTTGISFLTHDANSIERLLIMSREIADGERELGTDKEIKDVTKDIIFGKTTIDSITSKFGKPLNSNGTLYSKDSNINHQLHYWDFSKMPKDKPIIEKMLIIGCDKDNTIQDLFWISSMENDIKSIGDVKSSTVKDISGNYGIGNFIDSQKLLISTDNLIDRFKVDDVMSKINSSTNVNTVIENIGLPTARGIYRIYPNETLIVASWSHSTTLVKGKDRSFVPFEATEDNVGSYLNIAIKQTRLIIMHDQSGIIREVMWLKPYDRHTFSQLSSPSSIN